MSQGDRPQILILSAPDEGTLARRVRELADSIEAHPGLELPAIAWSLQTRDKRARERAACVCPTREIAISALRGFEPRRMFSGNSGSNEAVFMFPGYGAQFAGMGAGLYAAEAVFREAFDECCAHLREQFDLRAIVHAPESNAASARAALRQARVAEPAIFSVSYALARLWMSWGIQPAACIGHGVGEYVAATLAGVFSLRDALRVVATRSALIQAQPLGAMLAVRLAENQVTRYLTRHVSLAAINGPELTTLSGSDQAISLLELELAADGVSAERLESPHAFQSVVMEPILTPLGECLRGIERHKPAMPISSSVTGVWLTDAQAQDAQYWMHHARKAVRFSPGVARLLAGKGRNFIECGPGHTLTQLLRHHDAPACTAVACIRESMDEVNSIRSAAALLWTRGVELDWKATYEIMPVEAPALPELFAPQAPKLVGIADTVSAEDAEEEVGGSAGKEFAEARNEGESALNATDGATAENGQESVTDEFVEEPRLIDLSLGIATSTDLAQKAAALVEGLNAHLECCEVPVRWEHFGNLLFVRIPKELEGARAIFPRMQQRGVRMDEHVPSVVKVSHSAQDLAQIANVFRETIDGLVAAGLLPGIAVRALPLVAAERAEILESTEPQPASAAPEVELVAPVLEEVVEVPQVNPFEQDDNDEVVAAAILETIIAEEISVAQPEEVDCTAILEVDVINGHSAFSALNGVATPELEFAEAVVDLAAIPVVEVPLPQANSMEPAEAPIPTTPVAELDRSETAPEIPDRQNDNPTELPAGENHQQTLETAPIRTEVADEPRPVPRDWIGIRAEYPSSSGLDTLFEDVAAQQPDVIAVTDGKRSITYDLLNAQANMLAGRLLESGMRPGSLIGVCLDRGIDLLTASLAVLKIGCAYVPFDPSWPVARLQLIAKKSECATIITKLDHARHFGGHATVLDGPRPALPYSAENPNLPTNGETIACVMYLSGPGSALKGAAIPHRAIARLALDRSGVALTPTDALGHGASPSSETALFEMWSPLLTGGRIVVVPRSSMLDATELGALIRDEEITTMFVTSGMLNQFAAFAAGVFRPLHDLLVGGDVLNPRMISRILRHGPPRRLLHVYGFAETAGIACMHHVTELPATAEAIPVGRPLANVEAHILDERLHPVPIGEAGDLYFGGDALAFGYRADSPANAKHFIPKPSAPGARLFRTGDRARWSSHGAIEILGRSDDQVIVRGKRMHLSEVDAELRLHPKIQEGAARLLGSGAEEKALAAFYVPKDGALASSAEVHAFLRRRLPEHMVPGTVTELASIPHLPDGQVDRAALPAAERAITVSVVPALNPIEARVAEAMAATLGLPSIAAGEDFFQLGGSKLLAMDLLARLRKAFGTDVPAPVLFESPNVRELARYIAENRPKVCVETHFKYLVPIQRGESGRTPLFLVAGGWGGEVELLLYAQLARLIDPQLPVYGFKARGAGTAEPPHASTTEMAADYLEELRAIQPCGPYRIAGEWAGGICAHEMACQLREAGEQIADLILLNTTVPSPDVLADFLAQNYGGNEISANCAPHGRVRHSLERMTSSVAGKVRGIFGKNVRASGKPSVITPATQHPRGIAEYPVTLLNHRLRKYAGRVTLLVDAESSILLGQLGWENVPVGDLDVHTLPGDRISYLREEAPEAAEKLRAILSGTLLPL